MTHEEILAKRREYYRQNRERILARNRECYQKKRPKQPGEAQVKKPYSPPKPKEFKDNPDYWAIILAIAVEDQQNSHSQSR